MSDYTSNSTEYLSTTKKFIRGEQLVFSVSSYFDYVTFLAVSYTHLDVYKRQIWGSCPAKYLLSIPFLKGGRRLCRDFPRS